MKRGQDEQDFQDEEDGNGAKLGAIIDAEKILTRVDGPSLV